MANLDEAFKLQPRIYEKKEKNNIGKITYDTTCPKCKGEGYCFTNDRGSIGGCIKCNITYKSKIIIKNNETKKCIKCGLTKNNHNSYHLFDDGNGRFNPHSFSSSSSIYGAK